MANPPPKIRWGVFFVLALLALAIRLPQLSVRPMHTDEAVNAYIMGQLLAGQPFRYDPRDRHGPALAAVTLPLVRLEGARNFAALTEAGLRLSPVLAGTATVLLFGEGVEMFGFVACFIAALLFALAPLPVYYNRYFIHESWFVVATMGAIFAAWHTVRRRLISAAVLTGFCAGFMLACKETALLHFGCLAFAAAASRFIPPRILSKLQLPPFKLVVASLVVFLFTAVVLFTWFGHNFKVFGDLMRAIPSFAARAGGEGHEKPFWYYARLLAGGWPGALLIFLAVVGAWRVFTRRGARPSEPDALPPAYGSLPQSSLCLILAIYGVAIFAVYSLIPYKTPWLALNFWPVLALMAGMAVDWAWFAFIELRARALLVFFLGILGLLMAHDTRQRVFVNPVGESNPYAYAHTGEDLLGLPERIAEVSVQWNLAQPRIAVVAADAWPLPWYLRQYSNVGYWQPGKDTGPADFFITSPEAADKMTVRLTHYRPEYFGVRSGVLVILWVPEAFEKPLL